MGRSFYRKNLSCDAQRLSAILEKKGAARQGEMSATPTTTAASAEEKKGAAPQDNLSDKPNQELGKANDLIHHDGVPAVGACHTSTSPAIVSPGEAALFSDNVVCRFLGLERYRLEVQRTAKARGVEWGVCALQAGMTYAWLIRETMAVRGVDEAAARAMVDGLEAIKDTDGVVSCKVVGVWPNRERVTVEIVATGERKICAVPRIDQPPTPHDTNPMGIGWIFDAKDFAGSLAWTRDLNDFAYYRTKA